MSKIDPKALFNIGYGLYVITSRDGDKDNGLIVNTVSQITNEPLTVAVAINKSNYSHDIIKKTGKMNVCPLSESAPFKVFEHFGMQSGRNVNKFEDCSPNRSENGLIVLPHYINSFFSLEVENYVDMGTHGLFLCSVVETGVISDENTMTYTYYHKNVKPKPASDKKRGFVCTICGYVHEEDTLPEDFVCPLCLHPASDFRPL